MIEAHLGDMVGPIIWGDCLTDAAATKGLKNWLKVKVPRLEEGKREKEDETLE